MSAAIIPCETCLERLRRWAKDTPTDLPLYIWPHEVLEVLAAYEGKNEAEAADLLRSGELLLGNHILKVKDL